MNKITRWNKNQIIVALQNIYKMYGKIQINKLDYYRKKGLICDRGGIRKRFGSIENAGIIAGIKFDKEYKKKWTKKNIISSFKKALEKQQQISKKEIRENFKTLEVCCDQTIREKFGSLDSLASVLDIEFVKHRKIKKIKIGTNEKDILDFYEKKMGHKIIRQYYTSGRFLDGYIPELNVAIEVDEKAHRYKRVEDYLREEEIKSRLGCEFIRIRDGW